MFVSKFHVISFLYPSHKLLVLGSDNGNSIKYMLFKIKIKFVLFYHLIYLILVYKYLIIPKFVNYYLNF